MSVPTGRRSGERAAIINTNHGAFPHRAPPSLRCAAGRATKQAAASALDAAAAASPLACEGSRGQPARRFPQSSDGSAEYRRGAPAGRHL